MLDAVGAQGSGLDSVRERDHDVEGAERELGVVLFLGGLGRVRDRHVLNQKLLYSATWSRLVQSV